MWGNAHFAQHISRTSRFAARSAEIRCEDSITRGKDLTGQGHRRWAFCKGDVAEHFWDERRFDDADAGSRHGVNGALSEWSKVVWLEDSALGDT